MAIRVGIGGWTFEPWRGVFYPEGLSQAKELAYAATHLATIEINGTFYRTPSAKSCADWARQVPDGFVFALKATRYVTHRKVLAEAQESIGKFISSGIVELGDRLGPINWQFAATKAFDPDDFAAFLALLPKAHDGVTLRHALEVRHPSFAVPEFVALARRHEVAVVFADHETYPAIPDLTADFTYARLQQTQEKVTTGYSAAGIARWAKAGQAWAKGTMPDGLAPLDQAAAGEGGKSAGKAAAKGKAAAGKASAEAPARDVFIYLISGAKVRNPAGAMALQTAVDKS
ncbi:DUF72 domain-containing protein [Xanthobacter sp. KR7-65]|uniref:DUF72 domain-containing protein n=1 Tax=Xanthobacter sp. KR7-65 TaxID=3156612 RepID=UPI0032B3AFF3